MKRPTRIEICEAIRKAAEKQQSQNYIFGDSDLMGACGICSTLIVRAFRKYGYSGRVVYGTYQGEPHCWVESNKIIYDVTATQFDPGAETVYWAAVECNPDYKRRRVMRSQHDYINWPSWQIPVKTNLQWFNFEEIFACGIPAEP